MKSEREKQLKKIMKLKLGNDKAAQEIRLSIAYSAGMSEVWKAARA